jgi:molybdate transport system regulatory protein
MPRRSIRIAGLPRLQCRTKLWLEVDGQFAIGEGGFDLLRAIHARGSLVHAAKDVGWSYRHAWGYLRRAEWVLGAALTQRRPGKGRRRGLNITVKAAALLRVVVHKRKSAQRRTIAIDC